MMAIDLKDLRAHLRTLSDEKIDRLRQRIVEANGASEDDFEDTAAEVALSLIDDELDERRR